MWDRVGQRALVYSPKSCIFLLNPESSFGAETTEIAKKQKTSVALDLVSRFVIVISVAQRKMCSALPLTC